MSRLVTQTPTVQATREYVSSNGSVGRKRRSDQEWGPELKGEQGQLFQAQAHKELTNYLYVSVYNFLLGRQPEFRWLARLEKKEVVAMAQDFVQICMEKLCRDDYAVLEQYSGVGSFTGWATQIALNEARSELRKVRWNRLVPLEPLSFRLADGGPKLEDDILREQLGTDIYHCLEQLPDLSRVVLVRCIMEGEDKADVARDLGRTVQAVYNLIHRAKEKLRPLLIESGLGPEVLALF